MRLVAFAFCLVATLGTPSQSAKETPFAKAEKAILELTNAARKAENLPPLKANALLAKCALLHSENMAKQQMMAHELDGKTAADRIKAIGYRYRNMGENVAYGDKPVTVEKIFDGWMKSEGHRKNILKPEFTEIGVGVAMKDGKKYYTQVFGRPLR